MVVLAAGIVSKSGRVLLSRQFVDISRVKVEGLLSAFPKLVPLSGTYVESEVVRYLFQSLESNYLVIVTNKKSNILEDLETLSLCGKLFSEFVGSMEEDDIVDNAFEIIFAMDEVVALGHSQKVSVSNVLDYMEMESHEEITHLAQQKIKQQEAKDAAKKAEKAMREAREKEADVMKKMGGGASWKRNSGFGSNTSGMHDDDGTGYSGSVSSSSRGFGNNSASFSSANSNPSVPSSQRVTTGLKLGAKPAGNSAFLSQLANEGEMVSTTVVSNNASNDAANSAGSDAPAPVGAAVVLAIEEKCACDVNKDGGIRSLEVKGGLSLCINGGNGQKLKVMVSVPKNVMSAYQFKTHPNVEKTAWANEQVLCLKDVERPFPAGPALGLLKWRWTSEKENEVPLMITCWPSTSGRNTEVAVEYELQNQALSLRNVVVSIPTGQLPGLPNVTSIDGTYTYDGRANVLHWQIALVDRASPSGSLEFTCGTSNSAVFFPVNVAFTSNTLFLPLTVKTVLSLDTGRGADYECSQELTAQDYSLS
jgi:coatomer subunit delta